MRFLLLTSLVLLTASHAGAADPHLLTTPKKDRHSGTSPGRVIPLFPPDRRQQPPRAGRGHGYDPHRHGRKDGRYPDRDYWWWDYGYRDYVPPAVRAVPDDPAHPPAETVPATKPDLAEPAAIPLDPAGSAGRYPARGTSTEKVWNLGQILPPNVPHVKLDPAAYDLPRPPPGQVYARVRGDVLLIDETTRRVVSVVGK